jgi:D-alanyl-lipoteichoic acid acyltransferase DltB (MBOAT superfamily)
MLFNSLDFIIFFILVLTALAIIKNRQFQHLFLLGASYFFFYFSSNYLLSLLIASTVLDFYIAKEIWNTKDVKRKKILLSISLAGNLGLLGFFKYADFAIDQFNILGNHFDLGTSIPFLDLILPIGISFYTFQTISYTVDVYRGHLEPSKSFREFALFVAFFPQLVAGPILRAKDFLPQLREKLDNSNGISKLRQITIHHANLKLGITLMAFGFLKKMFFADNIAPLADAALANPIGSESFTIILGTIAFGIQIYGDFSGYSDIAIGVALILGFKIPLNFNKPYFATSPSDFWRRWHISLSTWLRDYLYIPLGGSKKSPNRTYLNLATVMFLGGLWHGASWNFVIWGMLHGAYLAIHKVILDKFPGIKIHPFFKSRFGKIVSILVTQYFVFLAWIPFRVGDTEGILYAIEKYIFVDFLTQQTFELISTQKFPILLLILFIILNYLSYKKGNLLEIIANLHLKYWLLFLFSITISILLFYDGNPENFIYFRF